jgi:hypothetical protein
MKAKWHMALVVALAVGAFGSLATAQEKSQVPQARYAVFQPVPNAAAVQPVGWRERCDGDRDRHDRYRNNGWYRNQGWGNGRYWQNGWYDRNGYFHPANNGWYGNSYGYWGNYQRGWYGNIYPAGPHDYYDWNGRWHNR